MDRDPDPAGPATPGPDRATRSAPRQWKFPLIKAGGIIVAAGLARLGSQFEPATPLAPFALVPASTGRTPADLSQADLGQESLLDPLRRLGGIPGSPPHLSLELRSTGGGKVVIRDIRAEVVQRRAAPAG